MAEYIHRRAAMGEHRGEIRDNLSTNATARRLGGIIEVVHVIALAERRELTAREGGIPDDLLELGEVDNRAQVRLTRREATDGYDEYKGRGEDTG